VVWSGPYRTRSGPLCAVECASVTNTPTSDRRQDWLGRVRECYAEQGDEFHVILRGERVPAGSNVVDKSEAAMQDAGERRSYNCGNIAASGKGCGASSGRLLVTVGPGAYVFNCTRSLQPFN